MNPFVFGDAPTGLAGALVCPCSAAGGAHRGRSRSLVLLAALAVAACGGGGGPTETPAGTSAPVVSSTSAPVDAAGEATAGTLSEQPADMAGEVASAMGSLATDAGSGTTSPTTSPTPSTGTVAATGTPTTGGSVAVTVEAPLSDTPVVAIEPVPVPAPVAAAVPVTSTAATGSSAVAGGASTPLPVTLPAADPGYITRFSNGEYLKASTSSQTDNLQGLVTGAPRSDPIYGGSYAIDPGALSVHYQDGDLTQRSATILSDPANPTNQVLEFLLKSANVRDETGVFTKGRVQLNAYDTEALRSREIRFTARMKLSADVDLLRTMSKTFDWLTISEWWNNGGWTGQAYPFRISVNIAKPAAAQGTALRFVAHAQTLDVATNKWNTTHWTITNTTVAVPTGRWVTLEYHLRQGNATEGRFYLALVPDGGTRQVVFDVQGWTHHPSDPAPDGVTHVNPLKLYTSSTVIDHVRNAGGTLGVLWDDLGFRLCAERYPRGASPCGPETYR